MRRIVGALAIALVLALAGCGGTDWNSAVSGKPTKSNKAKSAKSANAAKAARLAAEIATTERAYVNALLASSTATAGPHANAVGLRCMATAIVHGFGIAAFQRAGLTTTDLRKPDVSLKSLGAPTDQQIDAIGAAFQKCGLGTPIAAGLATGLRTNDAAAIRCMASQLDTVPAARRYLVVSIIGRPIDLMAAHAAVGVIAACVDLPTLFVDAMGAQIDPTSRACILDSLKGSEATIKDYIATQVANGAESDDVIQLKEALQVDINRCRPAARTGFGASAGSG